MGAIINISWGERRHLSPLIHIFLLISFLVTQSASQYSVYTNPLLPYGGVNTESGLPLNIRVGGLFDEADVKEEVAFKHAVNRISEDYSILPARKLTSQIERLSPGDSYRAAEKVCDMMGTGIVAVFGPQSPEAASHVQSICDAFELPHIETKWDYKIRKENYLINLAPHPMTLSRAFNDLVEAYEWEEYVIIYEDSESLVRLQDLIKSSQPPRKKASLRQLPFGDEFRPFLKDILRGSEYKNIIVDCSLPKLEEFFKQAQQVGLMSYEFSFIITSLDLQTVDLERYQYGDANITSFRLVDPDKPEVIAVVRRFNALLNSQRPSWGGGNNGNYYPNRQMGPVDLQGNSNNNEIQMITTDIALIYDAVHLFNQALHVLDSSQRIDIRPISCDSTDTWSHGYSIINYMKMVQVQGLTGLIQFSTSGYRTDIQLDVMQLTQNGLTKVGIWDSKFVTKFNWSRPEPEQHVTKPGEHISLANRTLVITTIKSNPFIMYKLSKYPLKGNDQYEGYVVDFAKKLSEILGFKFEIRIVGDGKYGNPDDKGVWNGMIKEVQDGVADIAIADLSVNKARESAVDFTMPFMNLGISILHTKPKAKPPSLFSFLSPFSIDVWVWTCFAFFGVSIILFVIARLTPYEWDCPHPCIEDPDELENQFTLLNSFWFTIGSLMQQGSDVAPKITPYEWTIVHCSKSSTNKPVYINELGFLNALWIIMAGLMRQRSTNVFPKATSTRMIAGIWWFFTLIMVSSYTANLASFLIVQDLEETINSLDDLPKQTKVKYGCVNGGSTAGFFSNSPFPTPRAVWENMEKYNTFAPGNADGVQRVIDGKGKYAFFAESTVLEYFVERDCDLRQVGGQLDSKGYGVGLPKNSPDRQSFNSAILRLHEEGVLDELKRKWWKEERKGPQCTAGDSNQTKPLALDNVGGVFVVMVLGCVIAIVFTLFEFYFKNRESAKETGDDLNHLLKQELKFALSFAGDTKPIVTTGNKKSSLSGGEPGDGGSGSNSNQFLDLGIGMDSYGFPVNTNTRTNGGVPPDGFT